MSANKETKKLVKKLIRRARWSLTYLMWTLLMVVASLWVFYLTIRGPEWADTAMWASFVTLVAVHIQDYLRRKSKS